MPISKSKPIKALSYLDLSVYDGDWWLGYIFGSQYQLIVQEVLFRLFTSSHSTDSFDTQNPIPVALCGCNYQSMFPYQQCFNSTAIDVWVWMINCIFSCIDAIPYPYVCPSLANYFKEEKPHMRAHVFYL